MNPFLVMVKLMEARSWKHQTEIVSSGKNTRDVKISFTFAIMKFLSGPYKAKSMCMHYEC